MAAWRGSFISSETSSQGKRGPEPAARSAGVESSRVARYLLLAINYACRFLLEMARLSGILQQRGWHPYLKAATAAIAMLDEGERDAYS